MDVKVNKKTVSQHIVLCKHKVYCKCAAVSKHNSEQTVFEDTVQQQHLYLYKTPRNLALATNKTSPCEISHKVLICLVSVVRQKGKVFGSYKTTTITTELSVEMCSSLTTDRHCCHATVSSWHLNFKQTRYWTTLQELGVHLQREMQTSACSKHLHLFTSGCFNFMYIVVILYCQKQGRQGRQICQSPPVYKKRLTVHSTILQTTDFCS